MMTDAFVKSDPPGTTVLNRSRWTRVAFKEKASARESPSRTRVTSKFSQQYVVTGTNYSFTSTIIASCSTEQRSSSDCGQLTLSLGSWNWVEFLAATVFAFDFTEKLRSTNVSSNAPEFGTNVGLIPQNLRHWSPEPKRNLTYTNDGVPQLT